MGHPLIRRTIDSILIVEDDALFRRSLVRFARELARRVSEAASVQEAREKLVEEPDLILLDVRLSDGSGLEVVEAANTKSPAPMIVAMSGEATTEESFKLAQLGVRGYLQKPFSLETLAAAVSTARQAPPPLGPLVAGSVGHVDLGAVKTQVRQTMVRQALAMTGGNRSAAARLLGVSRQALQHIVRHDASLDARDADGDGFAGRRGVCRREDAHRRKRRPGRTELRARDARFS